MFDALTFQPEDISSCPIFSFSSLAPHVTPPLYVPSTVHTSLDYPAGLP